MKTTFNGAIVSLLLLLTFAFTSNAEPIYTITTCVEDHVDHSNCFKIQVTILLQDGPGGLQQVVSQGSAWVGSDCDGLGHGCNNAQAPGCPPQEIDGHIFYTYISSRQCLGQLLLNPDIWAAYKVMEDRIVNAAARPASLASATNQDETKLLYVYPNPAHSFVTVQLDRNMTYSSAIVTLYDGQGRTVAAYSYSKGANPSSTLVLKDFAPGKYEVVLTCQGKIVATEPLLIQ